MIYRSQMYDNSGVKERRIEMKVYYCEALTLYRK